MYKSAVYRFNYISYNEYPLKVKVQIVSIFNEYVRETALSGYGGLYVNYNQIMENKEDIHLKPKCYDMLF